MAIKLVIDDGFSQKEVSQMLNIPKSTLNDIIKKYNSTQQVEKSAKGGSRNVIFNDEIKNSLLKLIDDDCTITINSIIVKLNIRVNPSTVFRWLKSLNITFKLVRPIPISRNCNIVKLERKRYADWFCGIPIDKRYKNVVFVDESPFSLHMLRKHGRALRGQTPNPVILNNRARNITIILAVNALNVVLCEAISGNVGTLVFQSFLTKLRTILGEGDFIIVVDNVRFHHSNREFYDKYDFKIHYLPRYSPFLNPCEEVFSEIKSKVRRGGPIRGRDELITRMEEASNNVSKANLKNYFLHCESFFGQCHTQCDINRN